MGIQIRTAKWDEALAVYSKVVGVGMREAIYEEWPLLMEKIIDFTPPKTLKQGRAATSGDLSKTMRPFDPKGIRSKSIRKIVDEMDIQAFNAVASRVKSGLMAGARAVTFNPSVHTSLRNKRGRVPGRPLNNVVLGDNARALDRYKKELLGRVGWAKAGWLKAYYAVGGNRAPGFVSRHPMSGGDVIDDHANVDMPSITAINRTPWAARREEGQRIIRDAILSRGNAIVTKIKVKLGLAKQKAGFVKAG